MELALDEVPLRIDVLFVTTVLGVLALSVLAVRAVAQRAGQADDLWTMRAATGAVLWLVATGLASLSDALQSFSLPFFTGLMILTRWVGLFADGGRADGCGRPGRADWLPVFPACRSPCSYEECSRLGRCRYR